MKEKVKMVIRDLFAAFLSDPMLLPANLQQDGTRSGAVARVVCDYIAGMTDCFAVEEHRKLFGVDSWF